MNGVLQRIEIQQGDITKQKVDAIVNAANSALAGGGGVDGAIHRAGGENILKECKEIIKKTGGCQTGNSVITTGGNLRAKYVIHTVGPVWNGGNRNEAEKLAACYLNSLRLAAEHKIKTISFPNISTGIFGFPKKEAAEIALSTVCEFLKMDTAILKLIFVCFDQDNFNLYQSWVKTNFEKLQE